jgi:hypothetical protein
VVPLLVAVSLDWSVSAILFYLSLGPAGVPAVA